VARLGAGTEEGEGEGEGSGAATAWGTSRRTGVLPLGAAAGSGCSDDFMAVVQRWQ
jgi:hypothetical protein